MGHHKDSQPNARYVMAVHSLGTVRRIVHSTQRPLNWLVAFHEQTAGKGVAALEQEGCQPHCHQPKVKRRARVGEHLGVLQALRHLHLEPCLEADEGQRPTCLEGVWEARVAYQVEACLGGMDSQIEEDKEDIHSEADSTVVAVRD